MSGRACTRTWSLVRQCESTTLRPLAIPLRDRHSASPFSSTRWRADKDQGQSSASAPAQGESAAVQRARQQAARSGEMPEDLGLLPDTFVMPTGSKRPRWLSQFRQRYRLERHRLRIRFFEVWALLFYRYGWHITPKPRLALRDIPETAKQLHHTMYQQFAAGSVDLLGNTVVAGFLGKLRARIAERPGRVPLRWKLHEYKSPPKLVSMKVTLVPGVKDEKKTERRGIVQAVVRIHSEQSLQHLRRVREGKNGRTIKEVLVEDGAPQKPKELVEYVVVQKIIRKSREGPWKIWGTTEETTIAKLEPREGRDNKIALV